MTLTAAEDASVESAVDSAMDKIRDSELLDDGLPRYISLVFLAALQERLADFAGELAAEALKHGDGAVVAPRPPGFR